ncbi:MAG: catalase [Burkholderiales bacterium]|nr:MAG: catalase [Burkholderiales bacterium]
MSATRRPAALPRHPIVYSPELDPIAPDEAEVAREITEAMLGVARTTYGHSGHAIRSVHAKSHGILKGELEIPSGLPPQYAQGLFARPGLHPVVMRFSTIPGDLLPDSVSTPRGVAIKILGVEGERVEGAEGASTQDFIFVNGPTFATNDPKAFLANLKLVAATTDKAEAAKVALSSTLRAFGAAGGILAPLGGQPATHILGETFWNQLPIRFGEHIAKLQLAPISPGLVALQREKVNLGEGPDVLRAAVNEFMATNEGVWELRAQLGTDLDDTPIEKASQEWKEEHSPFFPVARIRVAPQTGWSEARTRAVDDGMGFSPWHSIEAHRPLGQMMRIRKMAYDQSQRFRTERNAVPVREPDNLDMLDD